MLNRKGLHLCKKMDVKMKSAKPACTKRCQSLGTVEAGCHAEEGEELGRKGLKCFEPRGRHFTDFLDYIKQEGQVQLRSLICFWHLRTLSKNRTNERAVEKEQRIEVRCSANWTFSKTQSC